MYETLKYVFICTLVLTVRGEIILALSRGSLLVALTRIQSGLVEVIVARLLGCLHSWSRVLGAYPQHNKCCIPPSISSSLLLLPHPLPSVSSPSSLSVFIQQILQIIIIPTSLTPLHRNRLPLLLLLSHRPQNLLQLLLIDFLA